MKLILILKLIELNKMNSYFSKKNCVDKVWLINDRDNLHQIFYIKFNAHNLFPTYHSLKELEMELKMITKSELSIVPVYLDTQLKLNGFSAIYSRV